MIRICERCFNPIGPDEAYIRLAHLDRAHRDGSIDWVYAYLQRPGPGALRPARRRHAARPRRLTRCPSRTRAEKNRTSGDRRAVAADPEIDPDRPRRHHQPRRPEAEAR